MCGSNTGERPTSRDVRSCGHYRKTFGRPAQGQQYLIPSHLANLLLSMLIFNVNFRILRRLAAYFVHTLVDISTKGCEK